MYQVIIPAPASEYVELTARGRKVQGVPFRKHILNLGTLIHPKTGEKLNLDEAWYGRLKQNFDNGVCDIVQVPLADAQNKHTEDPLRNGGEVVGLEREGRKVFTILDARTPEVIKGLRDKTLLGASAYLNLDYTDTRTGGKVGPTLLHHCITNRPYVTGLDDYEEVVAYSAEADNEEDVVVLSPEEPSMTKDELLAQLKAEHGIDVAALEAAATTRPDMAQLTAALTSVLQGTGTEVKLSGSADQVELSDVIGAVAELAQNNVQLSQSVQRLEKKAAETEVQGYVDVGRVLPKQKAYFVGLAMNDRDALAVMLPDAPVVALSTAAGVSGDQGEGEQTENIDAEVARLAKKHDEMFPKTGGRPGSAYASRK